ncbi:MAG: hypothetical protein KDK70_14365 [Myxococcales bacterium]|nr:hypothetical protein [Myxococcales bacterium]
MHVDHEPWRRFAAGELGLGHRGHLRLTWEVLREHDAFEALPVMAHHLRALAAAHGMPDKYHATLTGLWMLVVQERMQRGPSDDFEAFLVANEDLLDSRALPGRYYRPQTLQTDLARRIFVLPDLTPTS